MTTLTGKPLAALVGALVLGAGVIGTSASARPSAFAHSAAMWQAPRANDALRLTITEELPFGPEPEARTCAADVSLGFFSKGGGPQTMEGRAVMTALCDDPAYTMIDATGHHGARGQGDRLVRHRAKRPEGPRKVHRHGRQRQGTLFRGPLLRWRQGRQGSQPRSATGEGRSTRQGTGARRHRRRAAPGSRVM